MSTVVSEWSIFNSRATAGEEQFGFMKGKGKTDPLLIIKQKMERKKIKSRQLLGLCRPREGIRQRKLKDDSTYYTVYQRKLFVW